MNMLEHQKMILSRVDGNNQLFKKELNKSIAWLNAHELTQLYKWLKEKYWKSHKNVINDVLIPHNDLSFS